MIIFADASFLYNNYYPKQAHAELARRFWKRDIAIVVSSAVVLEFRLGSIYEPANEKGWNAFLKDKEAQKVNEIPIDWEKLFARFEALAGQHREIRTGLADGLHVLAALQIGATHFLSFDFRSGQRAFARAVGLTEPRILKSSMFLIPRLFPFSFSVVMRYVPRVKNFLILLFSALIAGNLLAAETRSTEANSSPEKKAESNDPVEKEYLKLLSEDDAAQAKADEWIRESQSSTNTPSATLNLRIDQLFAPVKKNYEDFLQRHPKHVRARLAFGSFLNDIHDEDGAVKQWEKAREIDPKNPATWNNLANYYGHRGPVTNAFAYYAKAIELNPNEPVYYQNFATTVYLFRKDAMEYFHINETQVFDKALELYRSAIKLAPTDFILASDYAQSFYGTKPPRYAEGLVAWTDALKIARDDVEREGVKIHLGRINWKLGNLTEARHQLDGVTNSMYATTKRKLLENIDEAEEKLKSSAPLR